MWLPGSVGDFIKHVVMGISSADYSSLAFASSHLLQHSSPHMPTPRSHATMHCCLIDLSLEVCLFVIDLCVSYSDYHQGKRAIYSLNPGYYRPTWADWIGTVARAPALQSGHWSQSSNISHLILTCTMTPWNPVPCVKVSDNLFMWLYFFLFTIFIEVLLFYNVLIYAVKWSESAISIHISLPSWTYLPPPQFHPFGHHRIPDLASCALWNITQP